MSSEERERNLAISSLTLKLGGTKNEGFEWQERDTLPPLKLLPNTFHISLAIPFLATFSLATLVCLKGWQGREWFEME